MIINIADKFTVNDKKRKKIRDGSLRLLEKSQKILSYSAHGLEYRLKLSNVNEMIALEWKEHLKCLARPERRCRGSLIQKPTEVLGMTKLRAALESGLGPGFVLHTILVINVW